MSKCHICKKNEAVIFTSQKNASGTAFEGICLACAFKDGYAEQNGLADILKAQGITKENVDQITEMMNSSISALGDSNLPINEMLMGQGIPFMSNMSQNSNDKVDISKQEEIKNRLIDEQIDKLYEEIDGNTQNLAQSAFSQNEDAVSITNDNTENELCLISNNEIDSKNENLLVASNEEETNNNSKQEEIFNNFFGNSMNRDSSSAEEETETKTNKYEEEPQYKFLDNYGVNLNKKAIKGELDPLIGREKELARVIQILNRRSKNNPVILGEPGVGKTALAEGLAQRIVTQDVPEKLLDLQIYLLDITALVAGTQFRGQFESRMKSVVDEARNAGNIVLVIDELHNIMGAGDAEGSMNAANILKPALARGEIRVIGSTTLDEYRKHIEKDSALERRFQQVILEEPNYTDTLQILKGSREYYEKHHHVRYSETVLEAAVRMSSRYINERFQPDKSIDLIDEAGSRANLDNKILVQLHRLHKKEENLLNIIERLAERGPEEGNENKYFELQAETKSKLEKCKKEIADLNLKNPPKDITIEDIASVISLWTGIPTNKLTEAQSERLLNLEENIHQRIIGQNEAVSAVSKAIRRNRSGLINKKRPSSFIFVGPTGVGKTELVKALTFSLFDREDALVRLDMSEYMEAHTVSKLIGSPPGYVGYNDGGQLSETIRRKPYSVILLDEIEKAHSEVFNILLQVLDEGRLTDSQGRLVNFENTIIIMTSNAGTSLKSSSFGFASNMNEAIKNKVHESLEEIFRPEFLNRVDEIIVFNELSKSDLIKIVDLMLVDLKKELNRRSIELKVDTTVKNLLVDEAYNPKYGARQLRRTITKLIEDKLTDCLLRGELENKKLIKISVKRNSESKDASQRLDFKIS